MSEAKVHVLRTGTTKTMCGHESAQVDTVAIRDKGVATCQRCLDIVENRP